MAKTYGIIGREGAKHGFYRGAVAAATAEAAATRRSPPTPTTAGATA